MITYNLSALPTNKLYGYDSSEPRTKLSVIATSDPEAREKAKSLLRKFGEYSDWKWTTRVESVIETPDEPEPVILEAVSDRPKRPKPARL